MDEKIKLSVIIKTKNNEDRLCETLESIKDFDEIIILDEHSTDDTVEIAKEYKAKIIYADKNDLSIAYNQALNESLNEWILVLEENEILPQKLIFEIEKYISKPKKNKNCVSFCQKYFYLNKEIKHAQKKNQFRLFKKGFAEFKNNYSMNLKVASGKIHKIKPNKNAKNAYILKFSDNDVSKSILNILDDNLFYFKENEKKKPSVIFKPLCDFFYYYFLKGLIFDGKSGYIYAKKRFIESFIYQVMLYEKETKNDL